MTFATTSAEITPNAGKVFDQVVESLLVWPEVKVEIGGHTDSSDNEAAHETLLQTRAARLC